MPSTGRARILPRSAGGVPIDARTSFRHRLRTAALAELALLCALLAAPEALAETAATTLAVSSPLVGFGEQVVVSGSVNGGPGCSSGRDVTLQWRAADSSGFATVATGTSGAVGIFSFEQSQPHTGRYRATIAATPSCPAATSDEALVRVRAFVDAALVAASTEVGDCVTVTARLRPSKTGQIVELQQRTDDGWVAVDRPTLDQDSGAEIQPCFGADDVGVVRLRVRWVPQDQLNETSSSPVLAFEVTQSGWMRAIDDAIGGRAVSVAVGEEDAYLYRHRADVARTPASNEKLLLSMVMLDTFEAGLRMRTTAAAPGISGGGVVERLWILGRGDPLVGRGKLAALARELDAAGLTRVTGRVIGSTSYFRRDWDAPGWNDEARDYVNRPTALTFQRNSDRDPERHAAGVLTNKLEALGVRVGGTPRTGSPPPNLQALASVGSASLQHLLTKTLRPSDNFLAEMLGKRLGAELRGVPGSIAKGAASIQSWTDARGTGFTLNDNSGLSYANQVTAEGIVRLLWVAEDASWGTNLRRALPTGGQGTLVHRLHGVRVRAKTGTLDDVSALSGWVFARGTDTWVEFSILSFGMSKSVASDIEDRIVRILRRQLR
ncbi:MAG TPA: D-alanyl-D-alanine carboxypeptidase [Actinomycetota bacterium]|nr:D-alanyl-D-alanine carboxypeptidase [Actinomycetota bacterium]